MAIAFKSFMTLSRFFISLLSSSVLLLYPACSIKVSKSNMELSLQYLDAVSEAVAGSVLRMKNIRRPDLRHDWHGGEVEAPGVDGGG